MKNKLLLVSALCFSTLVGAQVSETTFLPTSAPTKVDVKGSRTNTVNDNVNKSVIFEKSFDVAGATMAPFTTHNGPSATTNNTWLISGTSNGCVYTPVDRNSTVEAFLTSPVINVPAGPELYRYVTDITLNEVWFFPSGSADAGGGNFAIEMTNDGGVTWVTFFKEDDDVLLASTLTSGWYTSGGFVDIKVQITIPDAYKGVPIQVRYKFYGTKTASVYVQNAIVQDYPSDLVALNEIFTSDFTDADGTYQSTEIPLNQVIPMSFGVRGINVGIANTTRNVIFNIKKGTEVKYTNTIPNHEFVLGLSDTMFQRSDFTPTEVGTYTLEVIYEGTTPELTTVLSREVFVTAKSYAHTVISGSFYAYGHGQLNKPVSERIGFGSPYNIYKDDHLVAINTIFYTGTTVGQVLKVEVKLATETGWVVAYEGEYVVKSADISSGGSLKLVTIPLEFAVDVNEGETILLVLTNEINKGLTLTATAGDPDYTTILNGSFGVGGATGNFRGFDLKIVLNGVFEHDLAVAKLGGMENVTIFPNPSTGVFNINNTSNEVLAVTVTDITGKVITTTSVFGNGTIDMSSFGAGVYVFELSNATSRSTQRVVVR